MKRTTSTDNQAEITARFALAGKDDPTIAAVLGRSVSYVRALRKEYEISPGETRWLTTDAVERHHPEGGDAR